MIRQEAIRAKDLIDPELLQALAAMPDLRNLSDATLSDLRNLVAAPPTGCEALTAVDVQRVEIARGGGAVPLSALLYRPTVATAPSPALINFHGGGFVSGSAMRDDRAMRSLTSDLGCVGLSIDYALAPEVPFPGALRDAYASLAWVHDRSGELGIDTRRIGLRGVSAGGGLAVMLALLAADRAAFPIRHAALIYPMLDDRTCPSASRTHAVWPVEANRFAWARFLGRAGSSGGELEQYAVPARAVDVSGFPPTFIAVGSVDLFVHEDIAFANRLIEAGIATELHVYPGAYHGFDIVKNATVARAMERDLRAALRRGLGMSQPAQQGTGH